MDRQRWKHFKGKLLKDAGEVVKFNISQDEHMSQTRERERERERETYFEIGAGMQGAAKFLGFRKRSRSRKCVHQPRVVRRFPPLFDTTAENWRRWWLVADTNSLPPILPNEKRNDLSSFDIKNMMILIFFVFLEPVPTQVRLRSKSKSSCAPMCTMESDPVRIRRVISQCYTTEPTWQAYQIHHRSLIKQPFVRGKIYLISAPTL